MKISVVRAPPVEPVKEFDLRLTQAELDIIHAVLGTTIVENDTIATEIVWKLYSSIGQHSQASFRSSYTEATRIVKATARR